MARGLRCLLGSHSWVKKVVEGRAYLVCSRCGRESYESGGTVTTPPIM